MLLIARTKSSVQTGTNSIWILLKILHSAMITMAEELLKAIENKVSYEELKGILEKHPEAAKVQDNEFDLPLHVALRNNASKNVIKMLFNANPDATKEQNDELELPLHIALEHEASKQ
jgi:ankyrin repeat protein